MCKIYTNDYITNYIKDLFIRFRPYPFFRGGKKKKNLVVKEKLKEKEEGKEEQKGRKREKEKREPVGEKENQEEKRWKEIRWY